MNFAVENTKSSLQVLDCQLQIQYLNSPQHQPEHYSQIRQHRDHYCSVKAPHLLQPDEVRKELEIDRRSRLFSVSFKDKILASLRMTARPFEVESYQPAGIDFSTFENYLEISRLVTTPELEQVTSALVVKHLLCAAGLFVIENENCPGLVAMCRPFRASLFGKFGMEKICDLYSNERQIYYLFLAADMPRILQQTGQLLSNEKALRQRLIKTFFQEGAS